MGMRKFLVEREQQHDYSKRRVDKVSSKINSLTIKAVGVADGCGGDVTLLL